MALQTCLLLLARKCLKLSIEQSQARQRPLCEQGARGSSLASDWRAAAGCVTAQARHRCVVTCRGQTPAAYQPLSWACRYLGGGPCVSECFVSNLSIRRVGSGINTGQYRGRVNNNRESRPRYHQPQQTALPPRGHFSRTTRQLLCQQQQLASKPTQWLPRRTRYTPSHSIMQTNRKKRSLTLDNNSPLRSSASSRSPPMSVSLNNRPQHRTPHTSLDVD